MNILLLDSGLGLIPFVKEIIKCNKKNTYYLYMDNEFFPYGSKTRHQLKRRLQFLIRKFNKLDLDEIYICCNTLSKIYLDYKFKSKVKIKTILELNLKHLNNKKIIVTPLLKKLFKNDDRFIKTNLALYIERNEIRNIIDEIKSLSLSGKVILGCTHYPLIKNIIKHYANADILSYENEFISKLKQDETLTFKVRCYEKEILEKYFNDLNISLYELA